MHTPQLNEVRESDDNIFEVMYSAKPQDIAYGEIWFFDMLKGGGYEKNVHQDRANSHTKLQRH